MLLKWDPIYSVNVEELDEQHKKMFEIINRVYGLSENNLESQKSLEIINELKEYGNYHLGTEEKYFKKFNYPEADSHIAQHNEYKKVISAMENNLQGSGGKKAYEELKDFLQDWWLGHIQNVDQQYSDFFNQNGLY
jgi:hemerythrin-like metal-binding protein